MDVWNDLDARYRVILCDVWGVVHDGVRLLPGAAERLRQWRREGRFVVLMTNAPRTADNVAQQLADIGLPSDCWDEIVTSGEAGIAALLELDAPVGFIGTAEDRAELEGRGVRIAENGFSDFACTGLDERRADVADYRDELDGYAKRGIAMHCLNPDRMVLRGGVPEACAGALADVYESLGGCVHWYGKPDKPIYRHALELAGNPPADTVLAIGDNLQTDMLGASRMGFDAVYVGAGDANIGAWRPIAVVEGLA